MLNPSSYLRFLPAVLWEAEPAPPAFSLATALLPFEKLLSGMPDGVAVTHGDHQHDGIEQVIARIPELFDPWKTPADFLSWLATWVALEFPPTWSDYQRRKITGEIAVAYRQRGLKAGLDRFLGLYATGAVVPRIAIDDSSKLWFCQPAPGRFATAYTLTAQLPLVRPYSLTLAPDRTLLIGDQGTDTNWKVPRAPAAAVYQLPPITFGTAPFDPPVTRPQPIGPAGWIKASPAALVTDDVNPGWSVFALLDVGPTSNNNALFRLTSPGFASATPLATGAKLQLYDPFFMIFDRFVDPNGALIILDAGAGAHKPQLVVAQNVRPPKTAANVTVSRMTLNKAVSPISLLGLPNHDLLLGDPGAAGAGPADFVTVTRPAAALNTWAESPQTLLTGVAANPLAAPVAMVLEDAIHLLVVDAGLKPYYPPTIDPFIRDLLSPSAIYRVDLQQKTVVAASESNQFVFPTGMVIDQGTVYVSDHGDPHVTAAAGPFEAWRALTNAFGIAVHFPQTAKNTTVPHQILNEIRSVVDREKPAHTVYTIVSVP